MTKLILLIAAIVVLVLIGASIHFLDASQISAVVGLPMLSIGAVIVLIILLCAMAVVFAQMDLQDKTQALALPEGSIRAVIALMLIVLFAILTIYLYGSLAAKQLIFLGTVDDIALANLAKTHGESNIVSAVDATGGHRVWLRMAASQDGVDFAKQLLVLVGTLVTSICSFYFGSRATSQAVEKASSVGVPTINSIAPSNYTKGAGSQDLTIQGSNLDRISGVVFSQGDRRVGATDVKPGAGAVRFKLNVPVTEPTGVWQITLVDAKLGEQMTTQILNVA